MPAAAMAGSSCAPWPNLYEFLLEAELDQYYNALRNDLKVATTPQLKYVQEDDLSQLGMTKPEQRRLRKFYSKYYPQNYIMKIKKMILPKSKEDPDRSSMLVLGETSLDKGGVRVPSKHIISPESIVINKELGVGEFGVVQQGVWTNEDGERIQVAIKCLSKERLQNDYMEFLKEAAIMHTIDHEHIVRLYGAVLDSNALMLVTELAPLRSLLECLKEPALRSSFPVLSLCDFALQICDGMQYLESKRLIHRDLAARNILVFAKNKVKISDFGLSRALGVGKDYYQTNFNVNLKLPIAWCAPECINYLRFTSASDVWAYGVTLWEMFSYGFQPWAALTGQQILEAIDDPHYNRLEQPECCPKEYYTLMLKCWQHDPMKRPRFLEILNLLPDCKAEQVQAVKDFTEISPTSKSKKEYLFYKIGDVITVLDKRPPSDCGQMWKGVLNNGKTGLFNASNTVAYLGQNLPTNRPSFSKADSKSSLYASRRSRLRPEMISKPQGDLKHTGHVGLDGAFFGDISFLGDKYPQLPKQVVLPYKPQEDREQSSLSRASSELSDKAPLLTKSHSLFDGKSGPAAETWSVVGTDETCKTLSTDCVDGTLHKSKLNGTGLKSEHEYHEISDEELDFEDPFTSIESPRFESLDFGPSLMDEVFKALNSTTSATTTNTTSGSPTTASDFELEQQSNENTNVRNEIQEITSKAMIKEGSKRKQAMVKPISAADQHTLESAIAMAKELASKSMLELDGDTETSSPHTPNSPTKRKFSFKFKCSPKQDRRNFSEEAESIPDIQDTLTEEAKEAYNSLVEKGDSKPALPPVIHETRQTNLLRTSVRSHSTENSDVESESIDSNPLRLLRSGVPVRPKVRGNKHGIPGSGRASTPHTATVARLAANASLLSITPTAPVSGRASLGAPPPPPPPSVLTGGVDEADTETAHEEENGTSSNFPPLPPRDRSKPPPPVLKCHQRKYPLVLPGTVSGDSHRPVVKQTVSSPMPTYCNVIAKNDRTLNDTFIEPIVTTPDPDSSLSNSSATENVQSRLLGSKKNSSLDDSFETQIQDKIDSLDNIPEEEAPSPPLHKSVDHVSCEDLLQFAMDRPNSQRTRGRAQGAYSDEVRIMQKVLTKEQATPEGCLVALNETDWDVHKAIKYMRLQHILVGHRLHVENCQQTLVRCNWDVQQAANFLLATLAVPEDTTEV